jgi:hypothetical protein
MLCVCVQIVIPPVTALRVYAFLLHQSQVLHMCQSQASHCINYRFYAESLGRGPLHDLSENRCSVSRIIQHSSRLVLTGVKPFKANVSCLEWSLLGQVLLKQASWLHTSHGCSGPHSWSRVSSEWLWSTQNSWAAMMIVWAAWLTAQGSWAQRKGWVGCQSSSRLAHFWQLLSI